MRSDKKIDLVIEKALLNTATEYVSYKKGAFVSGEKLTYEVKSNLIQKFVKEFEIAKAELKEPTEKELLKLDDLKEKNIYKIFNNTGKVFASVIK